MKPSWLAQLVINSLSTYSQSRNRSRLQRKILELTRRFLSQNEKRLISYRIGESEILLPLGHDLPIIRSIFPQYSSNIARLSRYISQKYLDLHLIDIGANIGDTVAIVRELSPCPILCIEGNKSYYALLKENIRRAQFRSVETVCAFVATYTGEITGELISIAGTAHFKENNTSPIAVTTLSNILVDFPEFQSSKLLKIDTDGFDCSILRSELDWLSKRRPVIFFEYDPFFFRNQAYRGEQIFKDLSTIGYAFVIFYDNIGDYLMSADIQRDADIVSDLQKYFVGRKGQQYLDVAVFHDEDRSLAEEIRAKELEWSLQLRQN